MKSEGKRKFEMNFDFKLNSIFFWNGNILREIESTRIIFQKEEEEESIFFMKIFFFLQTKF